MARYLITERAGRFVAGHRNTGVGTALDLPPIAAEHELRLGTLVPADLPPLHVEASELPDKTSEAPDTEPEPEPDPEPEAPSAAESKRKRRS
jgi:hypothetical protein